MLTVSRILTCFIVTHPSIITCVLSRSPFGLPSTCTQRSPTPHIVPQENVHAIIMIECPRLLFPFARAIIADAVRNGGFPPLMIDPVDFVSLYRQRMAEQQPQAAPPPG